MLAAYSLRSIDMKAIDLLPGCEVTSQSGLRYRITGMAHLIHHGSPGWKLFVPGRRLVAGEEIGRTFRLRATRLAPAWRLDN